MTFVHSLLGGHIGRPGALSADHDK